MKWNNPSSMGQLYQQAVDNGSKLFIYVETFIGNVQSAIDSMTSFCSRITDTSNQAKMNNNEVTCLMVPVGETVRDAYFNSNDYINAINNGLDVIHAYDKNGTIVSTISLTEFEDRMANNIADLKAQYTFLNYCFNRNGEVNSSDFITQLNNVCEGYDSTAVSNYLNILRQTSDPIQAIRNFFSLYETVDVVQHDAYIEIVDGEIYSGSVLAMAWSVISTEINQCFDIVWNGITHLGETLASIVEGIKNLALWVLKKMFGYLGTAFEIIGDNDEGILDMPLIQINFGEYSNGSCPKLYEMIQLNKAIHYSHYYNIGHRQNVNTVDAIYNSIMSYLQERVEQEDGTFKLYNSHFDILMPYMYPDMADQLFNVYIIRFGLAKSSDTDSNGKRKTNLVMQVFVGFKPNAFRNNDDTELFSSFYKAGVGLVRTLDLYNPIMPTLPFSMYENTVVDSPSGDGNENPYTLVKDNMFYKDLSQTTLHPSQKEVICGLLTYSAHMIGQDHNIHNKYGPSQMIESSIYFTNNGYGSDRDIDASFDAWTNRNTPMYTRQIIPFATHYQTTEEQAKEYIQAGLTILGAIAAVVVTAKTAKFIKNQRLKQDLASTAYNKAIWDYYDDPTKEGLNSIVLAKKKMESVNRFNRLLGISGIGNSVNDSLNNISELVTNSITNGQVNSNEMLSIIKNLITG